MITFLNTEKPLKINKYETVNHPIKTSKINGHNFTKLSRSLMVAIHRRRTLLFTPMPLSGHWF